MKRKKRRFIEELDENVKNVARAKRIIFIVMSISLLVFLVIAAFAVINEGYQKFIDSLLSVNLFYFILAFVVLFIGYLIRYPKWELYLKRLGVHIERTKSLVIYLSMYSMDITPGRWGRAVVAYTINKVSHTRFAKVFPAVVADNFTDFFGFVALSLIMAVLVQKYILLSLIITFLLMLPFIFIYNKGPFELIKKRFGNIRSLRGFFKQGSMYFRNSKMLGLDVYIYSMIYTIPSMFMNGLALYFVILSVGVSIGVAYLPQVVFIYTSSLLIGMITGIPGTIGVTDAALISYLTLFFSGLGIDFGLASVITILFRIVSLWFVEGFGFASLIYSFKYWN